ncbi:MAG: HD domain-containing protein [Anaplasmataceae bacterium]|nr:HD domain-containing protein [Anaplasmataceae bacterium]
MNKKKSQKTGNKKEKDLKSLANFIYEVGILSKTPRSGLWFLGTGAQSVAEHLYRTTMIAYVLSYLVPKVNRERLLFLSLIHDLGEGRTSDLNYIHQKYGRLSELKALEDLAKTVPFGEELLGAYKEEQARETLEAQLAKDADSIDWMVTLLEEAAKGNDKAQRWAGIALKRLKHPEAKKLGRLIFETHPDDWWFDEDDEWYVNRSPQSSGWRSK